MISEKIKQLLKRPMLIVMIFFLPLIGTIISSSFLAKVQTDSKIPVALVDQDHSNMSKQVVNRLQKTTEIQFLSLNEEQARKQLAKNKIDSIFMFPNGFQEEVEAGNYQGVIDLLTLPSSVATEAVREVVASEVTRLTTNVKAANEVRFLYKVYHIQAGPDLWKEAYHYTDSQWKPKPLMTIDYEVQGTKKHTKQGSVQMTGYVPLWGFFTLLICCITSDWMIKERSHLFKRMKTMQKGLYGYIRSVSAAYAVLYVLQACISFALFKWLYGVESYGVLLYMCIYVIVCVAFSTWLASESQRVGSYYMISVVMVTGLSIIGGSFFLVGELSATIEKISQWLPQHLLLYQHALPLTLIWKEIAVSIACICLCAFKIVWNVRSIK
ncbi:ABC transporter permease [Priestia aryabhattai]|uniref:ABC transporter permease n=1 Tax=Priestia aryabhattai TaxID=412384 RepID=UPI0008DD4FAA|nr:ABC transporter permease [Priestia aryabhattai]MBZ6489114.1 ABC transporter permease [Priestia aryabhattai]OHY77505.1 multidrug ABC transporter permease [Priestia aryabhattai]OVE35772.1 ABC transporter permease [Priestia aryabhattai]